MALTKNTPEKIKASLKIKAQGVEQNLELTYKNHSQEQWDAFATNDQNFKLPTGKNANTLSAITFGNAQMVLFLVASFDDGTDKDFPLTLDGLIDLEGHWPGALIGIVRGFHLSRAAEVEKN